MKKLHVGDLVEIQTPAGKAYAQLINSHKQFGSLLRVLRGLHDERPLDLKGLAMGSTQFIVFFPLRAAINAGVVAVVGNERVPSEYVAFPLFRAGVADPKSGKVATWWLWDGEKEWKVGELDEQQKRLPIRGVWNDTLLVDRIISGWTAETDPRT
jgi:hypothetical protein